MCACVRVCVCVCVIVRQRNTHVGTRGTPCSGTIKILLRHHYLIQSDKKEILLQHYVKFVLFSFLPFLPHVPFPPILLVFLSLPFVHMSNYLCPSLLEKTFGENSVKPFDYLRLH